VLPFRLEHGALFVAPPRAPDQQMTTALNRFTRLRVMFHLTPPATSSNSSKRSDRAARLRHAMLETMTERLNRAHKSGRVRLQTQSEDRGPGTGAHSGRATRTYWWVRHPDEPACIASRLISRWSRLSTFFTPIVDDPLDVRRHRRRQRAQRRLRHGRQAAQFALYSVLAGAGRHRRTGGHFCRAAPPS